MYKRFIKTTGDINYLEKVQEFINTNLVHEPIYENLKKEGPIYATVEKSTISLAKPMKEIRSFFVQNNYDNKEIIRGTQNVFKETVMKAINKQGYSVKSSEEKRSEIIVKGSKPIDVEEIITGVLNQITVTSDKALSDRRDKNLKNNELKQKSIDENLREIEPIYQNLQDIKTTEPIYQNTEELLSPPPLPPKPQYLHAAASHDSIGKNKEEDIYTKKSTISLAHWFETIKSSFTDCSQKIINAIHSSFKKIVRAKIEEQGYDTSSKKGESEINIYGNKPINVQKIETDIINPSLTQIKKLDKEKVRDLGSNYKGGQLKQEISKLLNVNLQEKDVNLNSVSRNPPERQVPPLPPRNHAERVIQSRNIGNNAIGRNG